MTSEVKVQFSVTDRETFVGALHELTTYGAKLDGVVVGYRVDNLVVEHRSALRLFTDRMELKLRKNDHKTSWRDKPVEALKALMELEIEEFRVALQYFTVEEARTELVDVSNFCLILWDRLGMLEQGKLLKDQ